MSKKFGVRKVPDKFRMQKVFRSYEPGEFYHPKETPSNNQSLLERRAARLAAMQEQKIQNMLAEQVRILAKI